MLTEQVIKVPSNDQRFPKLLDQISDPPKQLYCRGNLDLLNSECIAVVGTRKLTPYGKESAQYITAGLATAGFTIVSGLAMGIDAVAHQTTLDSGGKTIAVLGGGISDQNIGPKINLPLAKRILENKGLLVSEYSDKETIRACNFAIRDRIISGLSKGVVIVEADRDSGSLITAQCALDQNRDVFAVPGNIFSNRSSGSNNLIKNGAKLISSAGDVLDEYGYNLSMFGKDNGTMSPENYLDKNILAILHDRGEITADETKSCLPTENMSDILSSLSRLEIKGLIKQLSNGKYRKI